MQSTSAARPLDFDPRSPETRARVMIVEDELVVALDFEMRLTRMGYEVVGVCDNCADALLLVQETRPAIVLMDICIHGPADGIETARAIAEVSDVPVVFMTAFADPDTMRRAASTSPYGYLLKPFDERAVAGMLTVALQRHASEARARVFGAVIESANVDIALVNTRGARPIVEFVNASFLARAGCAHDAVVGRPPSFSGAPRDGETIRRLHAAIDRREYADGILHGEDAEGAACLTLVTVCPVPTRGGAPTHVVTFRKDITAQSAAEAALSPGPRFGPDTPTLSVAADFDSLLNVIAGFSEFAREGDVAARSSAPSQAHGTDVAQVVRELLPIVQRLVGPCVHVECRVDDGPMVVGADPDTVEQVLLNVVADARDALTPGGRLDIDVSCPSDPSGDLASGRYARILIVDTATDTGERPARRLFERLFPARPRGAGLVRSTSRMATSRLLIERAGGTVTIQDTPGEGTSIRVDLPLAAFPSRARS